MSSLLKLYSPEGFLAFSSILLLVFNATFSYNNKFKYPILNFEILHQSLTISSITLLLLYNMQIISQGFDFFFYSTLATQNLKIFLLFIFIIFFFLIWRSFVVQKLNFFEYFIILLLILLGLLLLINSYNLLSIYLGLEVQALGFYILAAFNRNSFFSSEAGLRYFISSSLMSGFFLFGSALVYGALGTINLYQIEFLLVNFYSSSTIISFTSCTLGCCLILISILFKLVVAPFHFWFPQIYDGSPLSSTILFSILPKVALINLFMQLWVSFSPLLAFLETVFFLIGIYSMVFGIFKMLKHKKLKKLYIYSSISNMGLLLCVLINNTLESTLTSFFFLSIYIITSFMLWGILVIIYSNKKSTTINSPIYLTFFNNLVKQNYIFSISICFLFFSLAAIPPFIGFLGKMYIYLILLKSYYYEISLILIYLGTFGVYYYIKFLKIILFENTYVKVSSHNLYPRVYFNVECTLYSLSFFLLFLAFLEPQFCLYICLLFF